MKTFIFALSTLLTCSSFAGVGDSAGTARTMDHQVPETLIMTCVSPSTQLKITSSKFGYKINVANEISDVVDMVSVQKSGSYLYFRTQSQQNMLQVNLSEDVLKANWLRQGHVVDDQLTCKFE